MAPRTTRQKPASARITRKRGESDPNEAPKKRKTRHSKGGSDDKRKVEDDDENKVEEEDGREVRDDNVVEPKAVKPARRGKKGQ